MRVLVQKMTKFGLLKLEMILGTVVLALAFIGLPVLIACVDVTLFANPTVLGVVLIGMLFFGVVGYFSFIRPYILYRKLPEVLAETDGEFLYIHANKEAKIPLSKITEAFVHVDVPHLFQKEFLRELIIHLFSQEYGNIVLEIEGYGKYKLRFVAYAQASADELLRFIDSAIQA